MMNGLAKIMMTSGIALGFAALAATPAWADPTPECNDSGVGGTECGSDSTAADFATAVGNNATASGAASVAVGESSEASGLFAVAIGQAALASEDNSTAVGTLSRATGVGSTATGTGAIATGEDSVANGINANAAQDGAVAIGADSVAGQDGSVAIGDSAQATAPDSVALGSNSVATEANTVSVGTVGGERRIVNVAAGRAPTDAVNVSQLNSMGGALTNERQDRIAADARERDARRAADAALGGRINNLGGRIDDLDFDMRRDRRDARAGTASALAAAGMPQAMDPGRSMIAGGVGTYRGRSAIAVGASHRVANGQAIFKVGLTYDTREHVGANAGLGFQF